MKQNNSILKIGFYLIAASVTGYMCYLGFVSDVVYTRGNEVSKEESLEGYYVKLGLWALATLFFVYLMLEETLKAIFRKRVKYGD